MDYGFLGVILGFGIVSYKSIKDIKKLEDDFKKLKTEIEVKKFKEDKKLESIKEILSWN